MSDCFISGVCVLIASSGSFKHIYISFHDAEEMGITSLQYNYIKHYLYRFSLPNAHTISVHLELRT